jgi:hypothetical protein
MPPHLGIDVKCVTGNETLQSEITWTQTSFSTNFGANLSASTAATYIFTTPSCTTTIITLAPGALNAEFQHFILRDLIEFHYFLDIAERGDRG